MCDDVSLVCVCQYYSSPTADWGQLMHYKCIMLPSDRQDGDNRGVVLPLCERCKCTVLNHNRALCGCLFLTSSYGTEPGSGAAQTPLIRFCLIYFDGTPGGWATTAINDTQNSRLCDTAKRITVDSGVYIRLARLP